MRCPDKVTALHPLTQRIVFANATYCVFSLTVHCSLLTAHNSSFKSPHRGGDLEGVSSPQQSSVRSLSGGIHADLCRARVII